MGTLSGIYVSLAEEADLAELLLARNIQPDIRAVQGCLRVFVAFNSGFLQFGNNVILRLDDRVAARAGCLGEGGHLCGDAIHLFEADLVDLGSGESSRSETAKGSLVTTFAAAEGVYGERGPGVRDVVRGDESGELLVGWKNFVVERADRLSDADGGGNFPAGRNLRPIRLARVAEASRPGQFVVAGTSR